MKRILLTACAVMATLSIYGQGVLTFANDAASLIKLKDKDTQVISTVAVGGTYQVGLWWAPITVTDDSQFTFVSGGNISGPVAGRFNLGKITVPGVTPAGAVINVQVRGWETSFGNYGAALAAGGYTDKSGIFSADSSDPAVATDPAGVITGVGRFTGLTLQVPEPSTIALGLLGLAGLFVLRRRS